MIVVDASALIDLILSEPARGSLRDLLSGREQDLHAPEILDLEVLNVLRRLEREGHVGPRRGDRARIDLADAPILRHSHRLLLDRIWSLRKNLTAYDASYLALAEALGATLVTLDAGLARAAARFVPVAGV